MNGCVIELSGCRLISFLVAIQYNKGNSIKRLLLHGRISGGGN